MSAPKSVTKVIYKNGQTNIEYTSNIDATQYYVFELNRGALRDVGKFLRKQFKADYYTQFKQHSGDGGNATNYKVYSNAKTTYPRMDIGLKTGKVDGFYAYFQEVGSSKTPRLAILQNAVKNNVDTIKDIESQYLSALGTGKEESLIDEKEFNEEGEL